MSKNFNEILSLLTNNAKIGIYMIHLEKSTDRVPLIKKLENDLNIDINVTSAVDGRPFVDNGHPTYCFISNNGFQRQPGEVGCLLSHLNICIDALSKGYDYAMIFEDDCEFISNLNSLHNLIQSFIDLKLPWEIFLFGYRPSGLMSVPIPNTSISKINGFDCTHSLILNKNVMELTINQYHSMSKENKTMPIDTLYSYLVRTHNLNVYGPTDFWGLFKQKDGIYSYIIDDVRWK